MKRKQKFRDDEISSVEQALTWNSYLKSNEYRERRLTWGKYTNTRIRDLSDEYVVHAFFDERTPHIWRDYLTREFKQRYPSLVKHLTRT